METHIGFLYKAASSLHRPENNESLTLLRSYYLMQCKEVTKGYGLPDKHFSSKIRCSRCCVEWRKGTKTKVRKIQLSKKQKRRIRALKANKGNKEIVQSKKELLHSKQIEQICTFCKQSTVTLVPKPDKIEKTSTKSIESNTLSVKTNKTTVNIKPTTSLNENKSKTPKQSKNIKVPERTKKAVNVYSNSTEVFSMKNKKNTIETAHKEVKIIKNNKKKKDKFAGLCQKAVLATAKIKQAKEKQNKLSLFLKPSS